MIFSQEGKLCSDGPMNGCGPDSGESKDSVLVQVRRLVSDSQEERLEMLTVVRNSDWGRQFPGRGNRFPTQT